jgi:hypothetical protein
MGEALIVCLAVFLASSIRLDCFIFERDSEVIILALIIQIYLKIGRSPSLFMILYFILFTFS